MFRNVQSFLSHIADMIESCVLHRNFLNYICHTYKDQMKDFKLSPLPKRSGTLKWISNKKRKVSMPKIVIQIPVLVKSFSIIRQEKTNNIFVLFVLQGNK